MMLLQDLPTLMPDAARAEWTRRRCRALLERRRRNYCVSSPVVGEARRTPAAAPSATTRANSWRILPFTVR